MSVTASQMAGVCALAFFIVLWARGHNKEVSAPSIGYGPIPIRFIQRCYGAIGFMMNPQKYIDEGYQKYKGSLFRISTLDRELVLVADQDKFSEYLAAPDNVVSSQTAGNDMLQVKYTVGELMASSTFHIPLVRINLTQHIGRCIWMMRDEITRSFDQEIGHPSDWVEVPIVDVLLRTIAKVGNRILLGEELAQDEKNIQNAIDFTMDTVISSFIIRPFPEWLKGFVALFTPVHKRKLVAIESLGPHIQQRIDAVAHGNEVPDDMLTWLVQTTPEHHRTISALMETIMFINLGSIHTTSSTLSTVIYQIASEPEKYVPPLRQEIDEVFGSAGGDEITKQMLGKLRKLDSLMLETGRLFPPLLSAVQRVVLQPFRFKDGTLIPPGALLCIPSYAIQRDPQHFDNPEEFEGFRFASDQNSKRMNLASTSLQNSLFGHGRHACPGRFFAVSEMKMILAELLTRYDIKLIPGTKPKRTMIGFSCLPEMKLKILVRAAKR